MYASSSESGPGTRPPADVAASWHFRFGLALVAVLALSALTSRSMDRRIVRSLNPWIGVAALLVAAAQDAEEPALERLAGKNRNTASSCPPAVACRPVGTRP